MDLKKVISRFGLSLLFAFSSLSASVPVMPLEEVKVGMEGVWDTVIEGDKLQSFKLRVLGVSPHFVGPRKPVIICEAIDPDQILSGPVAGMSGSPVYIDGKLVGAYAYGFTWPKSQAIIGVTPIEHMIEIADRFPPAGRPFSKGVSLRLQEGSAGVSQNLGELNNDVPHQIGSESTLSSQLPFPLYASGVSQKVLDVFASHSEEIGIDWKILPSGTSGYTGSDWSDQEAQNLNPGMPVAGVLMGGDFSMTGVGTVTWKDGNRILGFGHPFFGSGDVEIPMAAARIITVVRSLQVSFKLSEVGPVVGSIYQDRLTGIAGELGRKASTIDVEYTVKTPDGGESTYTAEVFEHPRMSPLLMAIGLLQSLSTSLEVNEHQTLYATTTVEVEGFPEIVYENTAIGTSGAIQLAIQLLQVTGSIADNPFEFPVIKSVRTEVMMKPVQHYSYFDEVTVVSDVPAPGESLDVNIKIRNFMDESEDFRLTIPIPVGTKGETLTLQISDARQLEPGNSALVRADMDSVADIVRKANEIKSNQNIYVRLLKKAEGFQIQGDTMYDLPPSITHLISTPKNAQYSFKTSEVSLWESSIETDGVFMGSYRLNIEIK